VSRNPRATTASGSSRRTTTRYPPKISHRATSNHSCRAVLAPAKSGLSYAPGSLNAVSIQAHVTIASGVARLAHRNAENPHWRHMAQPRRPLERIQVVAYEHNVLVSDRPVRRFRPHRRYSPIWASHRAQLHAVPRPRHRLGLSVTRPLTGTSRVSCQRLEGKRMPKRCRRSQKVGIERPKFGHVNWRRPCIPTRVPSRCVALRTSRGGLLARAPAPRHLGCAVALVRCISLRSVRCVAVATFGRCVMASPRPLARRALRGGGRGGSPLAGRR